MNLGTLSEIVAAFFFVGAPVVAAAVVGVSTRGRVRTLGLAGFGLFALDGILGTGWVLLFPMLARDFDINITALGAGYSLVTGLLSLAAFALLALAVVTDRRSAPQPPPPPAHQPQGHGYAGRSDGPIGPGR